MQAYASDEFITLEYSPVVNKFAFPVNTIGTDAGTTIDEASYVYADANSIFVSDTTGDDTTGDGSQSNPYKTILKGINECTITQTKVLVLDSVTYNEDLSGYSNAYFEGVYAATGQTPKIQSRLLGYTPADANSIFVSKTGDDSNAGTQAAPKLTLTGASGAISVCDATHQKVVILDSGTYEEDAFEFTGNFQGVYAAVGQSPTIKPSGVFGSSFIESTHKIGPTQFEGGTTDYIDVAVLGNGNWVCVYRDVSNSNQGTYVIYDADGNNVAGPTVFVGAHTTYLQVAALDNGNWVCCYRDNDDSLRPKFQIRTNTGSSVVGETQIQNASASDFSVTVLDNTDWIVFYRDSNLTNGMYAIYEEDGTPVVSATEFTPNRPNYNTACKINNGNVVNCYSDTDDSNKGKFVIYDEDGVEIVSPTVFDSSAIADMGCCELSNGNWAIFYRDANDSSSANFKIYNPAGVQVVARTEVEGLYVTVYQDAFKMQDGYFGVTWQELSASRRGMYAIYTDDGEGVVGPLTYEDSSWCKYGSSAWLSGYKFVTCYQDDNASDVGEFVITEPPTTSFVKVSVASTVNGIEFDLENSFTLEKLFNINSAKLTLKWSSMHDGSCYESSTDCFLVSGDNECDFYNNLFYSSDAGIYLGTGVNDCIVQDNIFYWISEDYAVNINGAAASSGDITVEHNDIFDCNAGLRLQNNNGSNEVVKNNNIHGNTGYGIYADTTITITYTIITDTTSGVTNGTSTILANPLYINEGQVTPGDIDLHIKTTVEGYFANSPAYGLADDTRNAGAYDVRYVGSQTTWSSITVPKPISMKPYLKPVDATNRVKRDGSITSKKTAQTEYLPLEWMDIDKTYYDDLLTVWSQNEAEVRIYCQPTTSPNTYNTYYILWNSDFSEFSDYWMHSADGRSKVKFVFARKFEL